MTDHAPDLDPNAPKFPGYVDPNVVHHADGTWSVTERMTYTYCLDCGCDWAVDAHWYHCPYCGDGGANVSLELAAEEADSPEEFASRRAEIMAEQQEKEADQARLAAERKAKHGDCPHTSSHDPALQAIAVDSTRPYRDRLAALARAADSHEDFITPALMVEELLLDDATANQVIDAGPEGFYAQHHGTTP